MCTVDPGVLCDTCVTRLWDIVGLDPSLSLPILVAPFGDPSFVGPIRRLRRAAARAVRTHPKLRKPARHLGTMHAGAYTYNVHKERGNRVHVAAVLRGRDRNAEARR